MVHKTRIINDPIYGFITIPNELILQLIEHPWFQRLRNIRQLGLGHYVYPGAIHTRFHHALGAMHLMHEAIHNLRSKNIPISAKEEEGALAAILLHDIGHGPFSHALEHTLVKGVSHEAIGKKFLYELNKEFKGKLSLAIRIFENKYPRAFFHQLVSSQLDMDRLDYLMRDSFFTGVNEGVISTDRIIKMLNVKNNELVVEQKGIYSVEKFLIARRLMYWQVYLHKTVLSTELLLIKILQRAKEIVQKDKNIFSTPALRPFLEKQITIQDFNHKEWLNAFAALDDTDIYASLKAWQHHPDPVLSTLSRSMVQRKLFRLKLQLKNVPPEVREVKKKNVLKYLRSNKIPSEYLHYFFLTGSVNNRAYHYHRSNIRILMNNGALLDVTQASDLTNLRTLSRVVTKHYMAYPKTCDD
ncbi:MAG: HD domain-containing protein [Bacteroidia bacterium]|nr:HD domain-containing protein [Bacteroidia bacterium]